METPIDSTTNSEFLSQPERPQFLSVLCILTWIACGFLFITTVWGALFQPTPEEQYEQIEKMREISPEAADQMELAFEKQGEGNLIISTILNLLAIGFCSFGAYRMWNLFRNGLYIYIAGEVVPYFGFLFGGTEALSAMGSLSGMGSAMVGVAVALMVILDLAFVIMYAANLKYMRRY
jgi:hypothetical protein